MTKIATTFAGGYEIRSTYSETNAELKIRVCGESPRTVVLDESDCDNLLRVYEYSVTPIADLCEFFVDVERVPQRVAYAISEHFIAGASKIAECVYAEIGYFDR